MSIIDSLVYDRTAADVALIAALNQKGLSGMTEDERLFYLYGSFSNLMASDGALEATDGELEACDNIVKGDYRAADLNRVEAAVDYIDNLLKGHGYQAGVVKINHIPSSHGTYDYFVRDDREDIWHEEDAPTESQMAQYLQNVAALRKVLPVLTSTPDAPPDMEGLTWQEANNIEKILTDIDTILTTMQKSRLYAAQPLLYCGFAMYMTVEQNPEYAVDSD